MSPARAALDVTAVLLARLEILDRRLGILDSTLVFLVLVVHLIDHPVSHSLWLGPYASQARFY
ncbi:MAG: hypothetical protein ABR525_10925, partial [Candidatus Limnocylindria bacterium]